MGSASCTNLQINHTNAPAGTIESSRWSGYSSSTAAYVGYNASGSKIYTSILKFTTPNFSNAISDILNVNLLLVNGSANISLKWALCTSDANKNNYFTTGPVTDNYQVLNGDYNITSRSGVSAGTTHTLSINTNRLLNFNTTYYLYLWAASATDGWAEIWSKTNATGTVTNISLSYIETYNIVYNLNGGDSSAIDSQIKEENVNLTLKTTKPTKSNSVTNTNFTITGNANGGNKNVSVTATKTVTVKYTFQGWGTSSADTTVDYNPGDLYTENADITLYAIWNSETTTTYSNNSLLNLSDPIYSNTVVTYTVKLDSQGADSSYNDLSAKKTTTHTFKGWGSSASSTTALPSSTTYTSATTVYAIWEDTPITESVTLPTPTRSSVINATYTVTLDYQDDDFENKTYTADNITSYSFQGWGTNTSATSYVSSPYTPTSSITLYAIWKSTTTTESIDLSSADVAKSDYKELLYVRFDTNGFNIELPTTSKSATKTTSYSFKGWSETRTGTTYINTYTPTDNKTLYGIWESTSSTTSIELIDLDDYKTTDYIEITLNSNGGTVETNRLVSSRESTYTLKGWGTASNTSDCVSSPYTPTNDIILYAIWNPPSRYTAAVTLPTPIKENDIETYIITLNPNGGSVTPTTMTDSSATTYEFNSWSADSKGNTLVSSSYVPEFTSDNIANGITLYAIYNVFAIGAAGVELPTPTRIGYKYLGWGTSASATSYVSSPYCANKSITLYAIWKAKGLIRINGKTYLVYIYHNGKFRQSMPHVYNNGKYKLGG